MLFVFILWSYKELALHVNLSFEAVTSPTRPKGVGRVPLKIAVLERGLEMQH